MSGECVRLHLRGPASKAILGAWAALSVVLVAYTLGAHLTRLPAPSGSDPVLGKGLRALFPPGRGGHEPRPGAGGGADAGGDRDLLVVHVLYDRCGCSARVGKALVSRGAGPGVREVVLLVSDDVLGIDRGEIASLEGAGFPVVALPTGALAERLHVQAVPLLVIVDGTDRVRYAGGYTVGRDAPRLEDQRLIAEARADRALTALPIFGCATAGSLQRQLDPFGIKYGL